MSNEPTGPLPTVIPSPATPVPTVANIAEKPSSDVIDLPAGRELNEADANVLAISRPVKLIVTGGPVLCGKTTLLTSLYESFQSGPVSGCTFAGSNTLPAFERRCFYSRIASSRDVPETERTPYGDPRYLHLCVCPNGIPSGAVDLLFSDVSGEAFERARDSVSECRRLGFLKRADHFLLLLDGEKLAQRNKRWGVAHETMGLLQTCLDAGMLMAETHVNVIWTKIDYVVVAKSSGGIDKFRADMRAEFETRFTSRVRNLRFSEIAARPTEQEANLPFGHGLPELL